MQKTLEQTYQKLSQRDHVLKRPETYMGSIMPITTDMWILENPHDLSNIKIVKKNITYTPAFIKTFDEILTNASDHYWRDKSVKYIKIKFDGQKFEIENDGTGIPVELHKKEKVYIPELIFGHLLAGSNFDDTEIRYGGGRNGLGAKITNIMSDKFIVETGDGKKRYRQSFRDNMNPRKKGKAIIVESTRHYTKIQYWPDWERFDMKGLDDDTLALMLKRVVDVAAYCPKVKVSFNNKIIPIKNIKDWMKLHIEEDADLYFEELDEKWQIGVSKAPDVTFEQASIVNGISTHRGGTHVNKIALDLSKLLYEHLAKRHKKLKFTWNNVKSNLFLFVISKVPNPTFDTQTKEYLTTPISKELLDLNFSDQFIKRVIKSNICQTIIDWIEAKELQELNKEHKKLRASKVEKLIDAKSSNVVGKQLFIFEGDCLEENTKIFILRDGQIINIPIKDCNIDDLVLTHKNRFLPIYGKTKKIKKRATLTLKSGKTIIAGIDHRLWVYDKHTKDFSFKSLHILSTNCSRYNVIRNQLHELGDLLEITDIIHTSNNFDLIIKSGEHIIESKSDHYFSVYNYSSSQFIMKDAKNLCIGKDYIVVK